MSSELPPDAPRALFAMRITPEALAALTAVGVVILALSGVGAFEQVIYRGELAMAPAFELFVAGTAALASLVGAGLWRRSRPSPVDLAWWLRHGVALAALGGTESAWRLLALGMAVAGGGFAALLSPRAGAGLSGYVIGGFTAVIAAPGLYPSDSWFWIALCASLGALGVGIALLAASWHRDPWRIAHLIGIGLASGSLAFAVVTISELGSYLSARFGTCCAPL